MTEFPGLPLALQLPELIAARQRVAPYVVTTPSICWPQGSLVGVLPAGTEVWSKLELFPAGGAPSNQEVP